MDSDLLRNIPLFAQLSDSDRQGLADLAAGRDFPAHQPVFWIGEKGDEMFIVQHGQVRLSYPDESGAEITVAMLGPGTFFGEISLLDGGPRTATARTEVDSTLLALDRKAFYQFLEKHPKAAVHMISVLGHRQRDAMAKLRGVRNVNEEVEQHITPLQRIVDKAAQVGASGGFLIANVIFIITWMVIHSLINPKKTIFYDDPPTFFWLGFMIALEGILLTIFVLNSQRRQAERDRIQADLEYQVNLKAQTDVLQLNQKMDKLLEMSSGSAGNSPDGGAGQQPK